MNLNHSIAFFDLEINQDDKIVDIGAVRSDNASMHQNSIHEFLKFIADIDFICGHNIINHDCKALQKALGNSLYGIDNAIDTLYLSPLLFPKRPYHRLVKDDKLQTEELNNPLNDSKKARDLFHEEIASFSLLDDHLKCIYYNLLFKSPLFCNFFKFVGYENPKESLEIEDLIRRFFRSKICHKCDLQTLITKHPISLTYALSVISANDRSSIPPRWLLMNFPDVDRIMFLLSNNPCLGGCEHCNEALNPAKALQKYFGFSTFRTYGKETLQENAIKAAIHNESLLAIFPTGGGKSITFQVPALMSGENAKALTVVISPLQSLMKDQVDNLEKKNITEAVTINGLLDPIERTKAIERIANGDASILYISPESLRSITIERLLLGRKIARFVIDEAHCFSAWGQDFRVDYLYIGDFINEIQNKKSLQDKIPVSCFTATAKQKVIEDIKEYFKDKLGLELKIFKSSISRTNLQYQVIKKNSEEEKYSHLRSILESKNCPVIVYVSRTKKAYSLAKRLTDDGFLARPYHGKMEVKEKIVNQTEFINNKVDIMVATSAFGMGVDKDNVGMVIHYDISDSLENYIQEAGRAGRDENITADCYILYNENDLDKHFILLNHTKITSKEINQIWKAIKGLTRTRDKVSNSALEIARKAGWDDGINEIETRVKTAIAALEEIGYVKRGQNFPRVFANSIQTKNANEAISLINSSNNFNAGQKEKAIRIIKKLFSSKSKRLSTDEMAESRVDYIADQLGLAKEEVIRLIELLKQENILAQTKDLSAFIKKEDSTNRSLAVLECYREVEEYLLKILEEEKATYNLKDLNGDSKAHGVNDCNPNKIKIVLNFWTIKNWINRRNHEYSRNLLDLSFKYPKKELKEKMLKRHFLSRIIVMYLFEKGQASPSSGFDDLLVDFSVQDLMEAVKTDKGLFPEKITLDDVEDALFFLQRIEAIKIEGGFLVLYNKLSINRVEQNNRKQYTDSDYQKLNQFYQQKVHQIHIVGEYAQRMIRDYEDAIRFVDDYFNLNYTSFLNRYFPGSRQDEIKRSLTPEKFRKLFGTLSPAQLKIINDRTQYIVVAAGPGSGKTRVLVHKLASLLLAEDIKHDQLLMLTFSRVATNEFKRRLVELIGNATYFIEIKTFHSYCFDLLGRMGTLTETKDVLKEAVEKLRKGEIELNRITKHVLVIDEAQDIDEDEFQLIQELIKGNEDMRIILVGDDDQNIYAFRGSDSKYMSQFMNRGAVKYELLENYRSKNNIVLFANWWAKQIRVRLKKEDCIATQREGGAIKIVEYSDSNIIVPLVKEVQDAALSGSTCVLTRSNDEAVQVTGLLVKNGLKAKLIQANDSFKLSNLYEVRYFSNLLELNEQTPFISDEVWNQAISRLKAHCEKSNKLETVLAIIRQFELTNKLKKFKSDWKTLLEESALEDFINIDTETIYVSTFHKAKGKEFSNMFLLLNEFRIDTDEEKRLLYVGITRAKENINIHYNGKYLKGYAGTENFTYAFDSNKYNPPDHLSQLLTHKDVQLSYFGFVQHRLEKLQSGSALTILDNGLGNAKGELIVKFSHDFIQQLEKRRHKGYQLKEARVNFIVFWKNEGGMEGKIILPEIMLKRVD